MDGKLQIEIAILKDVYLKYLNFLQRKTVFQALLLIGDSLENFL